jgi:putative endonuclease
MYVYILTGKSNTTFYVGVTSDLPRRVWEHKNKLNDGFTARYNLNKVGYYEVYDDELTAIEREKTLKKCYKKTKRQLIEAKNKTYDDLYDTLV